MVNSSAPLGVSASASTSEGDEDNVGEMGETDLRSELDEVSTINIGGCDPEDDLGFSTGSIGDTSIGDSERRSRYCSKGGVTRVGGICLTCSASTVGVASSSSSEFASSVSKRFFTCWAGTALAWASRSLLRERMGAGCRAPAIGENMVLFGLGEAALS